jgi:hypothetical protein
VYFKPFQGVQVWALSLMCDLHSGVYSANGAGVFVQMFCKVGGATVVSEGMLMFVESRGKWSLLCGMLFLCLRV